MSGMMKTKSPANLPQIQQHVGSFRYGQFLGRSGYTRRKFGTVTYNQIAVFRSHAAGFYGTVAFVCGQFFRILASGYAA